MSIYVYCRVSTNHQDFDRQIFEIKQYFKSHNINFDDVAEIVQEHESGKKSYEDRRFNELFEKCKPGDFIYAASTDRIGRNFADMVKLMSAGKDRGIAIIACKQNLNLISDDVATKIILTVMALIDQDERERRSYQTKNTLQARKESGGWVSNAGNWTTKLGHPFGVPHPVAVGAMMEANTRHKVQWLENSKAYKLTRKLRGEGKGIAAISRELKKMYELAPEDFCSRQGKEPSKMAISRWLKIIDEELQAIN
jgi:DNA invertase Pin-like site-specific DNA recombinase